MRLEPPPRLGPRRERGEGRWAPRLLARGPRTELMGAEFVAICAIPSKDAGRQRLDDSPRTGGKAKRCPLRL